MNAGSKLAEFVRLIEAQDHTLKRAQLRDSLAEWLVVDHGREAVDELWPDWHCVTLSKGRRWTRRDERAVDAGTEEGCQVFHLASGAFFRERLAPKEWQRRSHKAAWAMICAKAFRDAADAAMRSVAVLPVATAILSQIQAARDSHELCLYNVWHGGYATPTNKQKRANAIRALEDFVVAIGGKRNDVRWQDRAMLQEILRRVEWMRNAWPAAEAEPFVSRESLGLMVRRAWGDLRQTTGPCFAMPHLIELETLDGMQAVSLTMPEGERVTLWQRYRQALDQVGETARERLDWYPSDITSTSPRRETKSRKRRSKPGPPTDDATDLACFTAIEAYRAQRRELGKKATRSLFWDWAIDNDYDLGKAKSGEQAYKRRKHYLEKTKAADKVAESLGEK